MKTSRPPSPSSSDSAPRTPRALCPGTRTSSSAYPAGPPTSCSTSHGGSRDTAVLYGRAEPPMHPRGRPVHAERHALGHLQPHLPLINCRRRLGPARHVVGPPRRLAAICIAVFDPHGVAPNHPDFTANLTEVREARRRRSTSTRWPPRPSPGSVATTAPSAPAGHCRVRQHRGIAGVAPELPADRRRLRARRRVHDGRRVLLGRRNRQWKHDPGLPRASGPARGRDLQLVGNLSTALVVGAAGRLRPTDRRWPRRSRLCGDVLAPVTPATSSSAIFAQSAAYDRELSPSGRASTSTRHRR